MSHKQSLLVLFILVATVFLLRSTYLSPSSYARPQRYLQTNSSDTLPDNYTLTLAQDVSEKLCSTYNYIPSTIESQKHADEVFDSLRTLRGEDTLKDLIDRGEVQSGITENYLRAFVPVLAAIGVPLAVSLVGFIFCVTNWSCMCCPSCRSMRCGICNKPNSKSSINIYAVISIGFSLCVLGASISSVIIFKDVSGNFDGTLCQSVYMLEDLEDGKQEDDWFGMTQLMSLLWGLSDDLYGTRKLFKQTRATFNDLQTRSNELSNDLKKLENGFKKRMLPRAYFIEEEQYNPDFTQSLRDHMGLAYDGVATFQDNLTVAQDNFNTAVDQFTAQRDTVIQALDQGYNQTRKMETNLASSLQWLDENGETVLKIGRNFNKALQVATGVLIGLSGFSLFSVIVNFWSKYRYFNKCMHLSWFLMGIFMIVAWFSAFFLFPASVASVEACQVVDNVLNNETFANQTLNALFGAKQDILKDSIVLCMHGSREIIDNFNIRDKLVMVNRIQSSLDSSTAIIDEGQIPSSIDLGPLKDHLASIGANDQLDDPKTGTDLTLLTELSSSNPTDGRRCAEVRDYWVLNDTDCTTMGIASVLESQEPDNFGVGQNMCIPLERWMDPSGRDITSRYTSSMYQNCGRVTSQRTQGNYPREQFLNMMVTRFVNNREQLKILLGDINSEIDSITLKGDGILANARDSLKAPFNEVKDSVGVMVDKIYDQDHGLMYNTKCGFVETRIRSLSDELCVNLLPTIYESSVALIAGSGLASILTLTLFFLVRKLLAKQDAMDEGDNRKIHPMTEGRQDKEYK